VNYPSGDQIRVFDRIETPAGFESPSVVLGIYSDGIPTQGGRLGPDIMIGPGPVCLEEASFSDDDVNPRLVSRGADVPQPENQSG
jgi:hypothetical protein